MMAHRIKRALAFFILLFSITFAGAAMVFARPEPFFDYSRTYENITIYDTAPIPEVADKVLQEISETLAATPFPETELSLFVAKDGWREKLFFSLVPDAGGVVYYPLSYQHGFLAGADFRRDRLVKDERYVRPPRTLAYYGVHELAHILTGHEVGILRYHLMPEWVREGLAEYIALGAPENYRLMDTVLGNQPKRQEVTNAYGAYPQYRLLVSWFIEQKNWSYDDLFYSELSLDDAVTQMREELYQ